jgi:predicted O-methyltransferase YrrM
MRISFVEQLRTGWFRADDDSYVYGECEPHAGSPLVRIHDRLRWGGLGEYISRSRQIRGWARGPEAVALAKASASLGDDAVVVEIGSFVGCSAVLLAGARKLRGSGVVHCVDPFDGSGDAFSVPYYQAIARSLTTSIQECFEHNIASAGLTDWVQVHPVPSAQAAGAWRQPIDMLFLDGDLSTAGSREAFEAWTPHLRCGGILAVSNAGSSEPGHNGARFVVEALVCAPEYTHIRRVDGSVFAVKGAVADAGSEPK